jgi:protein disulfide-isomerase
MDSKRLVLSLAGALVLLSSAGAQTWTDDYEAAKTAAREQDRAVFLFFTGSDWCGWCKKLDAEILGTPEFAAFAGPNLVLVKIDFPRHPPLPPALANRNRLLAERFHVEGFPTIILLTKDGKMAGQLGYSQGGPGPFLQEMRALGGINWRASDSRGAAQPSPKIVKADSPEPMFNGAPIVSPKRYEEIQLKGIMGSKQRPMVILNDHTFMVGDSARIKFKDGQIKVTCKEIKAKSAVVLIEGTAQPQEVFLSGS